MVRSIGTRGWVAGVRDVPARCCLLLLFAVAGLWLSFPSFSQAAGADDLLGCSSLQKAIEREDGSIVAIGSTDGCNRNLAPPGWAFLVAVSPDGKLLPGFGNGGLVGVPNGADSLLLGRPDGGVSGRAGEALVSALGQRGFGDTLERMRALLRAQGIWQSAEDTAEIDAETGLKHSLALHYKSVQLNRELKAAEVALGVDPSEETFERLRDIQNQITTVDGTEALIEGFGSLSGRATRGF